MNLIVGLGKTGLSLAQYFQRKQIPFDILEENAACVNLAAIKNVNVLHEITAAQLQRYETIYLSPGVNPHQPLYATVSHKLSNDLNLFTHTVKKPYIAITGSNGKSTLVHLLEAALRGAGYKALAIGNNGVPMLDHIDDDVDYFVLELSSYQLELAQPFLCEVAYISNISQDHLDRHGTIEHYATIKAKLYQNCRYAVVNEDDALCRQMKVKAEKMSTVRSGFVPALKMIGKHNHHNALAVIAICELLNVDMQRAKQAITDFPGLEHRCEFIIEKNGVTWWNDSKGTNVESTVVAINSVSDIISGKLVMILGGQGKGQDFSPLVRLLQSKARAVILMGENKQDLKMLFDPTREDWEPAFAGMTVVITDSLQNVVELAKNLAQPGDAVLLSPACASLDMFKNYEDRGRQFKEIVKNLK